MPWRPALAAWLRPTLWLAAVLFLVNCQPSEPFLSDYLESDKGLSESQLDRFVWPADTYASFAFLLPVGLLAESVGYAPTIVLGLLCREATRLILLFAQGLPWMVVMQLTYAAASDITTVTLAFIYRLVPAQYYDRATAALLMAYHGGNVLGSLLGQLLQQQAGVRLHDLFYWSWAFTTSGILVFVLARPRPMVMAAEEEAASLNLRRQLSDSGSANLPEGGEGSSGAADSGRKEEHWAQGRPVVDASGRLRRPKTGAPVSLAAELRARGWRPVLRELTALYHPTAVRLWSVWWIGGLAAVTIFGNYFQTLFGHFYTHVQYGWLELLWDVGAVAGSLAPAVLSAVPRRTVLLVIGPGLIYSAGLVLSVTVPRPQALLYCWTVMTAAVSAAQQAWASAAIAGYIRDGRYALVFTCNTFAALLVCTIGSAVLAAVGAGTLTYYWFAAGLALVGPAASTLWWLLLRRRPGSWLVWDQHDREASVQDEAEHSLLRTQTLDDDA